MPTPFSHYRHGGEEMAIFFLGIALMTLVTMHNALAGEVMTERCSAEVAIVPNYDAKPDSPGTVVLQRDSNGNAPWSMPIKIQLGPNGHVRWWCHSTKGNFFDPGTWRIEQGQVTVKCTDDGKGSYPCSSTPSVKLATSAFNGWTPERSRCSDRSTLVRARLGPDRLLQIECLGQ